MLSNSLPADAALRTRAARVIPGGMYGHLNVARLPAGYPQFFARAEGATLWDVDGNSYVDFMCAYGPMVLGYGNREVEAAAAAQRELGDVLTGPSERLVELAEKLVGMVAHADWALFQRNGTDATTLCVVIARAATRKRKILVARGAYHGSAPWCTPYPNGATAEDRVHLVHYDYNDVASLEAAARSVEEDIAGIIASAFKHDYGKDQEMPTPAFAQAARRALRRPRVGLTGVGPQRHRALGLGRDRQRRVDPEVGGDRRPVAHRGAARVCGQLPRPVGAVRARHRQVVAAEVQRAVGVEGCVEATVGVVAGQGEMAGIVANVI